MTKNGFTSRNAENLVCKAFRLSRESDGNFHDLITIGQHIYAIKQDGVRVYFQNGTSELYKNGLILKWNYGQDMVETKELAKKMSDVLEKDVINFLVPVELQRPQSRRAGHRHPHSDLFFRH